MSSLEDRLKEDRALRDSAREVFVGEFTHVKQEMTPAALGERIADKVGEKADAVSDKAAEVIDEHGSKILIGVAALAGVAALWFARKPIRAGVAALTSRKGAAAAAEYDDTAAGAHGDPDENDTGDRGE